jgi:hypothetical protein
MPLLILILALPLPLSLSLDTALDFFTGSTLDLVGSSCGFGGAGPCRAERLTCHNRDLGSTTLAGPMVWPPSPRAVHRCNSSFAASHGMLDPHRAASVVSRPGHRLECIGLSFCWPVSEWPAAGSSLTAPRCAACYLGRQCGGGRAVVAAVLEPRFNVLPLTVLPMLPALMSVIDRSRNG